MSTKVKIQVVNTSGHPLPAYSTPSSAGMDLRASLKEPMTIMPGQRVLVPTGLRVAIPDGYEIQLRPRSGLAIKEGITLLNTPGTIDADYRGELCVILINLSEKPFTVNNSDRICQMVLAEVPQIVWEPVDELAETERGEGGFGHTGTK